MIYVPKCPKDLKPRIGQSLSLLIVHWTSITITLDMLGLIPVKRDKKKVKKKTKTEALRLSMKPGRKCGNCQEIGHHDLKNCRKVKEKTKQRH